MALTAERRDHLSLVIAGQSDGTFWLYDLDGRSAPTAMHSDVTFSRPTGVAVVHPHFLRDGSGLLPPVAATGEQPLGLLLSSRGNQQLVYAPFDWRAGSGTAADALSTTASQHVSLGIGSAWKPDQLWLSTPLIAPPSLGGQLVFFF